MCMLIMQNEDDKKYCGKFGKTAWYQVANGQQMCMITKDKVPAGGKCPTGMQSMNGNCFAMLKK